MSSEASTPHQQKDRYQRYMNRAYIATDPHKTNWNRSSQGMQNWFSRLTGGIDLPFRSISLFAGSWLALELGWPLVTLGGVVLAGDVWSIPAMVPFLFITLFVTVLISAANMIREIVLHLSPQQDNLLKALFRGYFWGYLSVGIIVLIYQYTLQTMPQLFLLPIFYLVPIEASVLGNGGTIPLPVFLGLSGMYLQLSVIVLVYIVGITASAIGGLEILRYVMDNTKQHGVYGAVFNILFLSVFPAVNITFSIKMMDVILAIVGGLI
ncbi:MAG: hypothetical protein ACTSYL_02270 [Candidatus Thorarchaeota archaeon]